MFTSGQNSELSMHVRKSDPEPKSEVRVQLFFNEFYENNFQYLFSSPLALLWCLSQT